MLTHVKELIEQNYEKLIQLWPLAPAGIYSAGLNRKEVRPITFAGILSVAKKADLFGHIDLVIVDECHLISPNYATTYRTFIDDLLKRNPALKIVGLSATPYRLGQGLLTHNVPGKNGEIKKALFSDICYDLTSFASFNRLIEEGFIAPLVTKKPQKEIDLSNVRTVANEYNQQDLQEAADRDEITKSAITEIQKQAGERKRWLMFSSGVEHAFHIQQELACRGIESVCVQDETTKEERRKAVEWFKAPCSGKVRALVNNRIFTTGFDCPEVDLIGCLFATKSPGLWVQILGRGTRPAPGKLNCLVLDFGGNARRLGPVNDPILPKPKGKGREGQGLPVKLCEACATYNHPSARVCCECGCEFPVAVKIVESASTEEVMSTAENLFPKVEIFEVNTVEYSRYVSRRPNVPDALRVVYWVGLGQCFMENICFEHDNYARVKAREWWKARSHYQTPNSVTEALSMKYEIAEPTHIRVWTNRKPYPEIKDYDFEGTAFKTAKPKQLTLASVAKNLSDDIPF